jgi:small conductance mechanosensitive channel
LGELKTTEGEDKVVLEHQIAEAKLEYLTVMNGLVDNLLAQEEALIDAERVRDFVEEELEALSIAIVEHIELSEAELRNLRKRRVSIEAANVDDLEVKISREVAWLHGLMAGYLENLTALEKVGLEESAQKVRRDFHQRLATRGDRLAGRIELTTDKLRRSEEHLLQSPDDAVVLEQVRITTLRMQLAVDAMTTTVDMMDQVDMDSSDHRRLLIRSTGEVTTDVFKGKVAIGLLEEWVQDAQEWVRAAAPAYVVKAFFFVLILVLFRVLAAVSKGILKRGAGGQSVNTSQLLNNMMLGLATRGIMILGFLVALSSLGIELGPLLAGFGIAGFIVGFALQDSLANFAAGIMILGYRPYDVDDLIEAGGVFGTVSHMSLVSTTILTLDNQTLIVPNAKIWGDVIKNVTNQKVRRVDLEVHVARSDDVDKVERVLRAMLEKHPKVLDDPEPNVRLHKFKESSLLFVVRPWVATEDYWEVYWDVTLEIKKCFEAEGITMPYPQREVHVRSD